MDTKTRNPTEKELLDGLLDRLLKNYKKPEDILGEQGLLKRLSKAVLERALGAELTDHLGYEKHDPAGYGRGNARNGSSEKTLKGKDGEITIEVSRDRHGTFEPQIVKKHQTRFDGFDEKILSMYARCSATIKIPGRIASFKNVTEALIVAALLEPGSRGSLAPTTDRAGRRRATRRHVSGIVVGVSRL